MIPTAEFDSAVDFALLSIDFGSAGMVAASEPEVEPAGDTVPDDRSPASRHALVRGWLRAMRRASAFHAAYRECVTVLAEVTRALDTLKRNHARLQDQYDALRARTMMGIR